mgnify:CR=1 FL=1
MSSEEEIMKNQEEVEKKNEEVVEEKEEKEKKEDKEEGEEEEEEEVLNEEGEKVRKKKSKKEKRERRKSRDNLEDETSETIDSRRLSKHSSSKRLSRRSSTEKLERRSSSDRLERRKSKLENMDKFEDDEEEIKRIMEKEELEVQIEEEKERQLALEKEKEEAALEEEKKKGKKGKKGKKEEKKPGKEEDRRVGYHELFKFADWFDIILMIVGAICSIGHGVMMPLFSIFFGDVVNAFGDPSAGLVDAVTDIVIKFLILAAAAGVASYFQVTCFMLAGQRQANRIRQRYFKSLLSQEIGWYDTIETGEITTRIANDTILIQEAISEKLGTFFQMFTMFIAGFVVGFVQGWRLALVVLAVVPLLMVCGAMMGKFLADFQSQGSKAYGKAGAVAEEVISSMRTVVSFGGEEREKIRYAGELQYALKAGEKKSHATGGGMAVTMLVMFLAYPLAFWYGNKLVNDGIMNAGEIVAVFFGLLIGAMSLGQAAPSITAFSSGAGAAAKIYTVIERKSKIDSQSDEGQRPDSARGEVEFKNVKFTYPNRPDQKILHGLSFKLLPGQTLAFVGHSGCGKSTSIALIERFYDADEGEVLFDGINVKDLSVKWLRENIGIVSQEPVLFNKTIGENISFGRSDSTQEEIIAAAKSANAHDFISKLPNGYSTKVGERGTQLSGGQKQRIAIARALIRNPKVLLLDEATSALDNTSEKIVQDALDRASKGRSTIMIAHRLSTVRNADVICVVDKGVIVEQGTHNELMAKKEKSLYQELVKLQEIAGREDGKKKKKKSKEDEEDEINQMLTAEGKPSAKRSSNKLSSALNGEEEENLKAKEEELPGVVLRSFRLNIPELGFMFFGLLGSLVNGGIFPVFSLLFSEVLSDLLTLQGIEKDNRVNFWCLMFIALAVAVAISNYLQSAMFGVSGERLTNRVRNMLFGALIHQDISFFDDEKNTVGVLATKLSSDATLLQGMTGFRVGTIAQLLSTLVIGLLIALISCWKLALVVLSCVPLVAFGGAMQLKLMVIF